MGFIRTAAVLGVLTSAFWWASVGVAAADPDNPDPAPGTTHAPAPPPMPGPPVVDHDGVYAVGTEILAGVYTSAGPVDGGTCYWRRVGAGGATVDNALTKQPQVVSIEPTDVAFKTRGCQGWQPSADAAPPGQTPPWLSQLQLRHNLDILNGLAGQSGNGQLPPY